MKLKTKAKVTRVALGIILLTAALTTVPAATTPAVGDTAPNFTLNTLDDKRVELKQLTSKQRVLLVVLRGWPGYQCPICTRQVQDFIRKRDEFVARGVQVLMVYPGPAEKLKEHAQEFVQDKQWPKEFLFTIDPDYSFTKAYGLRWEADRETAYPSTFIVDRANKVRFAKVSKEHGGRVNAAAALEALKEINP